MKEAALIFLNDLVKLKVEEKILFYTDKGTDPGIAFTLHESANDMGAKSEVFELDSSLSLPDMAHVLTEKIERDSFDIICELSGQYFYQTTAWQRALQLGARLYSLGGLKVDDFIRCVGKADHTLMHEFGVNLREIIGKAKSVQIITEKGTDIRFDMNIGLIHRIIAKLTGKQRPYAYVTPPSGKLSHDVPATFLGGQIAFNGIPETIEGTAVIDGYVWPPKEIGHVDEPIHLKIRRGRVTDVISNSSKAKLFADWINGKENHIKHFCVGFHPYAKLSGTLVEVERVFGYITVGIGEYPFHTDGVMIDPTLLLNRKIVEKEGSFIHKKLSMLEKGLRAGEYGERQGNSA